MASVDWSARPDQIEGLALREVGVSPFIVILGVYTLNHESRNMPQYLSRFAMVRKPRLPL